LTTKHKIMVMQSRMASWTDVYRAQTMATHCCNSIPMSAISKMQWVQDSWPKLSSHSFTLSGQWQ